MKNNSADYDKFISDVFERVQQNFDANFGVNWDVIDSAIHELLVERCREANPLKENKSKGGR